MNGKSARSSSWHWVSSLLLLVIIFGILFKVSIPYFLRERPNKMADIFNNLRHIDAAKNQWALDHNITVGRTMQSTIQPTEKDLFPYLTNRFSSIQIVAGETYKINPLGKPPEAVLDGGLDFAGRELPRGTTVRLYDETHGIQESILLPKEQTSN